MNKQIPWPLTIGSLLLGMGWGCIRDPTGPKIDRFCNSQPASATVAFEDANLEAAIRDELWLGSQGDLTCGLLEKLTTLTAGSRLHINSITDLDGLGGLTNLEVVSLHTNPDLSDIQPLLDNPGLGDGDDVLL